MGLFGLFGGNKQLKEDHKKLMSDALRHKSSLGGKFMNQRKQELNKKKRK
ncbi:hypothetical protein [Leuconostoc pseudomesenteroides]|nr:hypothetical protein [Leuconostoc pseudomesenteroides]